MLKFFKQLLSILRKPKPKKKTIRQEYPHLSAKHRSSPIKVKLSRAEIQRRAIRKPGSTITNIGKHFKGTGSKNQLKSYRRSVKARKKPDEPN